MLRQFCKSIIIVHCVETAERFVTFLPPSTTIRVVFSHQALCRNFSKLSTPHLASSVDSVYSDRRPCSWLIDWFIMKIRLLFVVAHWPRVGGSSRCVLVTGLSETCVFFSADPEHGHDERVAEAHDHHRKHKENDQLVPGECDSLEVAVEVAVGARHDCHVTGIVVVQHLPRVLRFTCTTCHSAARARTMQGARVTQGGHQSGKPGSQVISPWSGKLGKVGKIVVCLWCATAVAIITK